MAKVELSEQPVQAAPPGRTLIRQAQPRKALWKRVTEKWDAIQIENQGAYSIEHLESLNLYCKTTPLSRVVLVCVLSPVPALLVAVLVEIFPLRPPSEGWAANWVFWLRLLVVQVTIGIVVTSQMARLIPELQFGILKRAAASLGTAAAFEATCLLAANTVGFPIPFMIQFGAISRGIYGSLMNLVVLGSAVHSQDSPLKKQYGRYIRFFGPFMVLSTLFPFYKPLYNHIPATYRGGTVVILLFWKSAARQVTVRSTRALEDVMPVLVTLSVDFLSTMFIAVCMSSSRSMYLILVFIVVNIGQSLLEVRAMRGNGEALLKVLDERRNPRALIQRTFGKPDTTDLLSVILNATQDLALLLPKSLENVRLWACLPYPLTATMRERLCALDLSGVYISKYDTTSRWKPSSSGYRHQDETNTIQRPVTIRRASIMPCAGNTDTTGQTSSQPDTLTKEQQRNCQTAKKIVAQGVQLLFHSELVALVQYVETIVPIVFLVFKSALEHLPNIVYYPGGAGNWNMEAVANISLFATMEILLLLSFNTLLRRRFRFSPLYQLAYVLETEVCVVQAILFTFTLLVFQYELEHFGQYGIA